MSPDIWSVNVLSYGKTKNEKSSVYSTKRGLHSREIYGTLKRLFIHLVTTWHLAHTCGYKWLLAHNSVPHSSLLIWWAKRNGCNGGDMVLDELQLSYICMWRLEPMNCGIKKQNTFIAQWGQRWLQQCIVECREQNEASKTSWLLTASVLTCSCHWTEDGQRTRE